MSEQEYQTLWNYSEQFSRDKIQRSELVCFAFFQEKKLGERCTLGLQKSIMHFRGKEITKRSVFPAKEMGKRTIDAYNRPHRVHFEQPLSSDEPRTVGDVVLNTYTTPIDFAITNDFLNSLSDQEQTILQDLSAGYTAKEIAQRHHVTPARLKSIRHDLEAKAVEYLM
jgi:hypothetical protein